MYSLKQIEEYSDMHIDKLEIYQGLMDKSQRKNTMLEVGTRLGGTAMLGLNNFNFVISVDPYGNKLYTGLDGGLSEFQYPDTMYLLMLQNVASYALNLNKNFAHFKMTSHDFLKSNFSLWINAVEIPITELKYDFVLLDGDHRYDYVIKEINLLKFRINKGGIIAIDNIDWWGKTEEDLLNNCNIIWVEPKNLGIGYITF